MRETEKIVKKEIDGEEYTFKIQKMNALHGSFLMKFCAEKLLPVFNSMQGIFENVEVDENTDEETKKRIAEEKTSEAFALLPGALASISEDELIKFETRCLQTVYIEIPGGWQPVMQGDSFVVGILEYDAMTVLMLCYDVLEFNLSGFFGGKGLSSLLKKQDT